MTYAGGLGGTQTGAALDPIVSLSPNPVPAGPGQQVVTVHGSGLRQGFNLAIYPVDDSALTNPTTQGYSAPLYGVSADGTTASALIDLRGNVASWVAQIISPYTNEVSAPFPFTSVSGAVGAVDTNAYFFQSGQFTPVLAIATTQLIPSRNAQGEITNHIIVVGATASIPYPPSVRNLPGPGVLVNDPGAWRFVPAGPEARQIVESRFGNVVDPTGCSDGQVDVFGLPIVTPTCPGNLAWTDLNGNVVTSPWSTAAAPQPGTVIGFHPVLTPTVAPAYQPPVTASAAGGDVDVDATALVPSHTDPSGSTEPHAAPVPPAPFTQLTPVAEVAPSSVSPAVLALAAGVLLFLANRKGNA